MKSSVENTGHYFLLHEIERKMEWGQMLAVVGRFFCCWSTDHDPFLPVGLDTCVCFSHILTRMPCFLILELSSVHTFPTSIQTAQEFSSTESKACVFLADHSLLFFGSHQSLITHSHLLKLSRQTIKVD